MGETICVLNNSAVFHFHLSYEDIGRPPKAIFGGNIAGRRLTGVKINPLFLEGHSEEDVRQTESLGRNGSRRKDPAIRLNVYDLRSPAHNSKGDNGKRHTIVSIGGHEVISLSNDDRKTENNDVPETNPSENPPLTSPDVDLNIDNPCTEDNNTGNQSQKDFTVVSITPGSDLTDYRTNVSPLRLNGGTKHTCRYVGSDGVNSTGIVKDGEESISKDVQGVVVKYAETVETSVMDTPNEPLKWPHLSDILDDKLAVADCKDNNSNHDTANHMQQDTISAPDLTNHHSSKSKVLKPILVRSQSSFDTLLSSSGSSHVILEETIKELAKSNIKSVKFAEDTIDNENKTKRYVKERIDLSQVNKGQPVIMSGVVNPAFVGDIQMKNVNNNHTVPQVNLQLSDLNIPAYMQKYLVESPAVEPVFEENKTAPSVVVSSVSVTVPTEQSIEYEESPEDTSQDTEMSEIPGYADIVMKTALQERRKQAVKWTVITVVVVVLLVLAIALPIYFTSR